MHLRQKTGRPSNRHWHAPIRYLTLRRMHLVRRALLHAEPSKATVTRVVTEHGLWELGRFSVALNSSAPH
jgi:hypothetical protein